MHVFRELDVDIQTSLQRRITSHFALKQSRLTRRSLRMSCWNSGNVAGPGLRMIRILFGGEIQCKRWLEGSWITLWKRFYWLLHSRRLPFKDTNMSWSLFCTFFKVPFGPKLHFGDGANADRARLNKESICWFLFKEEKHSAIWASSLRC